MTAPLTITGGAGPLTVADTALTPPEKKEPSPEIKKAALEFESLLLRQMLESLEKTSSLGSKRATSSAYQSMVVDAMANGLSQAGGLGLSDLIARLLETEMAGGRHGG